MTQSLAHYHSRSPRYILQPQDDMLIRVAGPAQTPWEEGTEIKNISLSGLAFTAPVELCPIVGEFIKIQFHVPSANEMACFGLVTRLEPLNNFEMLVGIQFYKLEMSHRIVLLQGLAEKLKQQIQNQEGKIIQPRSFWHIAVANWKASASIIAFLTFWLIMILWAWSFVGRG